MLHRETSKDSPWPDMERIHISLGITSSLPWAWHGVSILCALNLSHFMGKYYQLHFIKEKIEAQRDYIDFPEPNSYLKRLKILLRIIKIRE